MSRLLGHILLFYPSVVSEGGKKNWASGSNNMEEEEIRHIWMSELVNTHSVEHWVSNMFVKEHTVPVTEGIHSYTSLQK